LFLTDTFRAETRRLGRAGLVLAIVSSLLSVRTGLAAEAPAQTKPAEAQPPAGPSAEAQTKLPTGLELMKVCGHKYPGDDQFGKFTVTLRDNEGRTKKSEYLRFWKDYKGKDGVSDKMLLFTTYPPDAKGSAFMRVAYTDGKPIDQWIYLPLLKKIRRVTIRDPGDSFLNSNLTYADVSQRPLDADDHRYMGVTRVEDIDFYVVESTPKEKKPLYGKRVFWFLKTDNIEDCRTARIDYYDLNGELLKDQFIKWQKLNGAWVWERVLVRSRRAQSASVFELGNMRVNTHLDDELFTPRSLEQGLEVIQKFMPKE
jgi:hypothetical protein